jgi:hypothetical protein
MNLRPWSPYSLPTETLVRLYGNTPALEKEHKKYLEGAVLARCDSVEPPFDSGDTVRLSRAQSSVMSDDFLLGTLPDGSVVTSWITRGSSSTYRVHRVYYIGHRMWEVVLNGPKLIRLSASYFSKVSSPKMDVVIL